MERFRRLEDEKINVVREMSSLQRETDLCKSDLAKLEVEKQAWAVELSNHNDLLQALKEGKRAVEQKLQNVLADNAGLSEQVRNSI